ncbi:MAG TPA: hypothetical protein VL443_01610 [Cyclobacteriaceae bacterium]|jgi:microcystin-dependent protein|nr:hypothetical protein [Cyclobacteriaceae bacterium]
MKFIYSLIVGLALINTATLAQVGFNNANPDPSSVLDLTSTDKGILIPRMTTTQRLAISAPSTALLVFDTTLGKFFYFNSVGQWVAVNPWDQSSTSSVSYTGSVGVNTAPASSAAMDVTATDKGILVPRMTTAQRTAIASPANALMVFDITLGKFCYYTNSQWNVVESIWSRGTGTNISYTGQVGVNNTTPDPSSTLDLTATDKGILVPRMTTTQRTAIASPANALMVFDITLGKFCYYTNSQWNVVESIWNRGTGTNISYTGQVGVNNATPDPSSTLDLTATDKGILVPRMTTTQRTAIASPANALMVFDITLGKFCYYTNSQWNVLESIWNRGTGTNISYTGQVGVNNATPAASSVLDLTATDKGILIPRMTTTQRQAISSPDEALLVYDNTVKAFYYYSNSQWNTLDTWIKVTGGISYTGQVGVNISTPDASSTVDITSTSKGLLIPRMTTAQRQAITTPATSLMVFDTNDSRFYFYNSGQWYAVNALDRLAGSTAITHTGNITVTGTVTATNFSGVTGTVPTGSIIMWYGTGSTTPSIPTGWALCDGTNGTPDLRGRFIVGYGTNDSDYSAVKNTGGEKKHALTVGELPAHSHTYTIRSNWGNDGGVAYAQGEDGGTTATVSTNTSGGSGTTTGATHENRPPYYVLAFIMKL